MPHLQTRQVERRLVRERGGGVSVSGSAGWSLTTTAPPAVCRRAASLAAFVNTFPSAFESSALQHGPCANPKYIGCRTPATPKCRTLRHRPAPRSCSRAPRGPCQTFRRVPLRRGVPRVAAPPSRGNALRLESVDVSLEELEVPGVALVELLDIQLPSATGLERTSCTSFQLCS